MKIVADENIPLVREAFASFGQVVTCPGREICPAVLKDADILLVRSITNVNAALLEGTAVRFVGTATIGVDHVDEAYLASRGIGFASAPGSNAESVAEYVVAALLVLGRRLDFSLAGMSLGVIGVGNVGSRVARNAQALGMKVLLNDPPLQRRTGDAEFLPLEKVLEADAVTLHVPLSYKGPDATYHLVDEQFLKCMRPGSVLINTSRGAVADERQLHEALESHLSAAVLDVWENEPTIDVSLLEKVQLGTPHIAGYSYDGKVTGMHMLYRAVCRYLKKEPEWEPGDALPSPRVPRLCLNTKGRARDDVFLEAVRAIYDIEADDLRMRSLIRITDVQRGAAFDGLRKEYPQRREFSNTTITLEPYDEDLAKVLRGLRFRVNAP